MRILLIEDNKAILQSIEFLLKDAGHAVVTDDSGEEFESLVLAEQPDVILLDIWLPRQDGRELCKQLKERKETQEIPVVLLSAVSQNEAAVEYCRADGYIPKPFTIEQLLSAITQFEREG